MPIDLFNQKNTESVLPIFINLMALLKDTGSFKFQGLFVQKIQESYSTSMC